MHNKPLNVFVLGSCVSRDPFEVANEGELKLVRYYARSSFASMFGKPRVDDQILDEILSSWQRKMVHSDMTKSVLSELVGLKDQIDVILVDLIDERFGIQVSGDEVVTISNEYKKSASKLGRVIKPYSPYSRSKMTYWEKGVEYFFLHLANHNLLDKVYINKVFYTHSVDVVENYTEKVGIWDFDKIKKANDHLLSMYEYVEKYISEDNFIKYPKDCLVADSNHRWGLSPFHYTHKMSCFQNDYLCALRPDGEV